MHTASLERAAIDALPFAIYTADLDGRITSANRPVDAESIHEIVAATGDREHVSRAMALLRAGRVPIVSWEWSTPVAEGDRRVSVMHVTPLHDDATHAVTGYVFASVDVTPSHESREALIDTGIALSRTIDHERVYREVAAQLRRAVGATAFCLAKADDDSAALRVAYATGYEGEESAALEARLTATWLHALANGRVIVAHSPVGLELTAPLASPEGIIAVMTVLADGIESPDRLDEATRVLGTVAAQTAAAIERAELVRRVEQKRRLEAIGEVSAGVAHELRNPLFGISSAAQLLRFRVREDPVVEKNVGRILREVERLNRMVTALLDYGRPSVPRLVSADPDAVWDDVLDGQRGQLESKSLLLQRERAAAPTKCLVDPEQLAQVFLNVLVNAVDAAPEATDLSLASCLLPSGAWRCRLRNGGPPIPAESLPRAFEIFYSTKPGGTGIGLALCQRIVDEHGGTIALESDAGVGTTLTITLPAAA